MTVDGETLGATALREIISSASSNGSSDAIIARALQAVRAHLGLQVA